MNKNTDFALCLHGFFNSYLNKYRNASANTLSSYSYTFSLFLKYVRDKKGIYPHSFSISQLNAETVQSFLNWKMSEVTVLQPETSDLEPSIRSVAT